MGNIEAAVQYMEKIASDNSHGYDQAHRGGNPDYDCSSLVGSALHASGFNVNPQSTTRNLRVQLISCGFNALPVDSPRQRGDIFLKEGHHVVMCIDSNRIIHASINEKGTGRGGKSGDQTGKEICVRDFYAYPGGWEYHLRYNQPQATAVHTQSAPVHQAAPEAPAPHSAYNSGSEYTLQTGLFIRSSANGAKVGLNAISPNARIHSHISAGHPVLNSGTVVTCREIKVVDGNTWMHIPSGWVCAVTSSGEVYIR